MDSYVQKPVWTCRGRFGEPDKVFAEQRDAEAHVLKEMLLSVVHMAAHNYHSTDGYVITLQHVMPSPEGGMRSGFEYELSMVRFDDTIQYAITKKSVMYPKYTYPTWTGAVQFHLEETT